MKKLKNSLLEKFRLDKIGVCEQGNRQILAEILKIGAVNFSPLWCGGGQDPNSGRDLVPLLINSGLDCTA